MPTIVYMITLFRMPSPWKAYPVASPFCLQVETYLRMVGLPYKVQDILDPREGSLAKLPYIVDQDRTVSDALFIIEYLKHRYGDPLNSKLTREQTHRLIHLQRTIDGSLMWAVIYSRWIDDQGWQLLSQCLSQQLPPGIRHVIPRLVRSRVRREMEIQGFGIRSCEWVYAQGGRNLEQLVETLGEQPYFLGTQPTSIDASVFSVLANILYVPVDSKLKTAVLRHPTLISYCERMVERYYPDLPRPSQAAHI